jgi:negative regulator of sigma E activity
MNDAIKTQVSAFVDGELPANEAELLLRRMSQDRELRQQAAEYLALGRAIRGERTVAGMPRLRDRIAAAIDAESAPAEPVRDVVRKSRYLRPLAGSAIAATVALAAIIGLQRVADVDEIPPTESAASAAPETYTVPAPTEDKLREYYLRHAASAAYVGAGSINARLVTLELPDGVIVEMQPDAPEDDAGDTEPMQPAP